MQNERFNVCWCDFVFHSLAMFSSFVFYSFRRGYSILFERKLIKHIFKWFVCDRLTWRTFGTAEGHFSDRYNIRQFQVETIELRKINEFNTNISIDVNCTIHFIHTENSLRIFIWLQRNEIFNISVCIHKHKTILSIREPQLKLIVTI